MSDKIKALAELLDITDLEEIEEMFPQSLSTYYSVGHSEYRVFEDAEADQACKECIEDLLWAFRPEFLAPYMPKGIEADTIRAIQGERFEDANEPLLALVGDELERLVQDAIGADGRGHFLSGYDGEEREMGIFYIYRTN